MNTQSHQENLKWYNLGLLSNLDLSNIHINSKGVYIWINDIGEKKRILYVGTANSVEGFQKRMGTHIGDIMIGKETVYKFLEDPYKIINQDISQIESLIKRGEFWYPQNKVYKTIQSWVSKLAMEFLNSVKVWICPLNETETSIKASYCIESLLLHRIIISVGITSWLNKVQDLNKTKNSWIGKQSRTIGNAQECCFSFNKDYLPDLYKDDLKYFSGNS